MVTRQVSLVHPIDMQRSRSCSSNECPDAMDGGAGARMAIARRDGSPDIVSGGDSNRRIGGTCDAILLRTLAYKSLATSVNRTALIPIDAPVSSKQFPPSS